MDSKTVPIDATQHPLVHDINQEQMLLTLARKTGVEVDDIMTMLKHHT